MQTTLVYQTENLSDTKSLLLDSDLHLEEVKSFPPIAWKLISQNPVGNIAAYHSGKIVIQGIDGEWAKSIFSLLNGSSSEEFVPHIGVDEAGKGDFFGPLVTGAVFVSDGNVAANLQMEGVRDSKTISDSTIKILYEKIIRLCPKYSVVVLNPEDLTLKLSQSHNINKTLAWAHSQAIENVLGSTGDDCKKVVIDQFSKDKYRVLDALMEKGKNLEVVQKHGGESDIAVAAASIVARAVFVQEMDKLSLKYGMEFPKGSSDVIAFAKQFVAKYGMDELKKVAKTSFKITSKIY